MRGFLSRVRTGCELFTLFQVSVHSLSQGSILSPYSHGTVPTYAKFRGQRGQFSGPFGQEGDKQSLFSKNMQLSTGDFS